MRKIVAVHHPHLDAKLLDQVLIKFYWLREQSELRKKPSTSELIDWISALLRSGISTTQLEAHIPFLGALLKKEQDVDALPRYDERERTLPDAAGPTSGRATTSRESRHVPRPLLRPARRRRSGRHPGVADASSSALEQGPARLEPAALLPPRRAPAWSRARPTSTPTTASSPASSRASRARSATTSPRRSWSGCAIRRTSPSCRPEQLAELERLTSDELMRRFLETLAEQTERHDGGDKWVGTGGKSPFGHGGAASDRHPRRRAGARAARR